MIDLLVFPGDAVTVSSRRVLAGLMERGRWNGLPESGMVSRRSG